MNLNFKFIGIIQMLFVKGLLKEDQESFEYHQKSIVVINGTMRFPKRQISIRRQHRWPFDTPNFLRYSERAQNYMTLIWPQYDLIWPEDDHDLTVRGENKL